MFVACLTGRVDIQDDEHADSFAQAGFSDRFVQCVMRDEASGGAAEGLTARKADEAIAILRRKCQTHRWERPC